MARKLRLTPLEGAIVAMLEEAGCEDVTTVINSLVTDVAERRALVGPFEVAVRSLVARGLVTLVWSSLPGYPNVGTARRELLAVTSWLRWVTAGYWVASPFENGAVGLAVPARPR
jgi:hypothetical protein